MRRIGLAHFAFVAGLILGQFDALGWFGVRLAEWQLPRIKVESLMQPSPFESIPREMWAAESPNAFAFADCAPLAAVHLLVVPKKRYTSLLATPRWVLAEMLDLVKEVARDAEIAESGFRVVINTNPHGTQTVYHTHFHVMGGEQLGFPVLSELRRRVWNSCG